MPNTILHIPFKENSFLVKNIYLDDISLSFNEEYRFELPEVTQGNIILQLLPPKIVNLNPNSTKTEFDRSTIMPKVIFGNTTGNRGQTVSFPNLRKIVVNKGIGYYILVKNVNNSPDWESERYSILIKYPSTTPVKTKKIPMSFFQRAFDGFWNNYKPIENVKITRNHDKVVDQYSIGFILQIIHGIPEEEPIRNNTIDIHDNQRLNYINSWKLPSYLYLNEDVKLLGKYSAYFHNMENDKDKIQYPKDKKYNILNRLGDVNEKTKIELKATIQKVAFEHRYDRNLHKLYTKIYLTGIDSLFELFKKAVVEDTLRQLSSNKIILTLKDELAWLYNRNNQNQLQKNMVFTIPNGYFEDITDRIDGSTWIDVHPYNININNIHFETIKNSVSPGYRSTVIVETEGKEFEIGKGGLWSTVNLTSIKATFEALLKVHDLETNNKENIEKKAYLQITPKVDIEYTFQGDRFIDFDINQFINDLKIEVFDTEKIISYLLGENYPIIDIWQMGDNMMISYLPKLEIGYKYNSIQPMLYSPSGNLKKFDNIVVVMQENRSFDHMLGYLKVHENRNDVNGLTGEEYNKDKFGNTYKVNLAPDTIIEEDPCHALECVQEQIGNSMDGFVRNFNESRENNNDFNLQNLKKVMSYYGKRDVPTFDYIANYFGICDNWFCSHPGQTLPNRFITYTGKLNKNKLGQIETDNIVFEQFNPVETLTIFDYLTKCNVSWKVFEHGYCFLRLFTKYTFDIDNIVNFHSKGTGFLDLAKKGELPSVTFIEPDYIDVPPGNDDHPPGDIKNGQSFLAKIILALQESPQWEKTLLIITYDEHGGFYDHVMPPNDAIELAKDLTRLGPRVPTLVVSPYVEEKAVSHELFDHTSILATILRRFIHPDLHNKIDLGPRVRHSNDIGNLLTLNQPRKITPDFKVVNVPIYNLNARLKNYKMNLPGPKNTDFHESLNGYRLLLGFPPK